MSTLMKQDEMPSSYPVEVSGWDHNGDFFAENCQLQRTSWEGETIQTRHHVEPGTIVFVRLVETAAAHGAFPIAYRVARVELTERRSFQVLRLSPMHPRPAAAGPALGAKTA